MDKETRDILTSMKAELSKGWIQGELVRESGVCLYGALIKTGCVPLEHRCGGEVVAGRADPNSETTWIIQVGTPEFNVSNMLATEVGETWQTLALWNDAPERTVDDIIDAIDRLLTRGQPLKPPKKNARKRLRRSRKLVPA